MKPDVADFSVEEESAKLKLISDDFSVEIDKRRGNLAFYNASGELLLREAPGKARKNALGDSVNAFCKFALNEGDALYGLGEFRDSLLNLRNARRELIQFNTQAAVPVLYSTGGWGIFWDNPSRTVFSDSQDGMAFVSDYGKVVDYYLFVGNDMDELVASYRKLIESNTIVYKVRFHHSLLFNSAEKCKFRNSDRTVCVQW